MNCKKISPLSAALILLFSITILNGIIIGRLGLSVDEAHYALYGNKIALSYFDHPPMVGWLLAFIQLFSSSDFALRLWPAIFNLLTSASLYYLSRTLFSNRSSWLPFVSVLLMQTSITFHVLSIALLPQGPFLLFGLWSIFFFDKILRSKKNTHFILLGVSLGLAGLSEYTAILLVIAGITFILFTNKKILFSYQFMMSLLIAALIASPVFYWNAQNGWVSFNYQLNHVAHNDSWSLLKCLVSTLTQSLSYCPVVYIVGLMVVVRYAFNNVFCYSSMILLLFFAYGSGFTRTFPHWVALAWLVLIPYISDYILTNFGKKSLRVLVYGSLGYSCLIIVLFHVLVFYPLPFMPLKYQPLKDLYGWDKASAVALQEQHHNKSEFLFVGSQWFASRLAWYSKHPVQIIENANTNQFSIWFNHPKSNARGILVIPYGAKKPLEISNAPFTFHTCKWSRSLTIYLHGEKVNLFDFYSCEGYIA